MAAERASADQEFPYSFIEIIDADHAAINRLAGRIRKILASDTVNSRLSELNTLLLEATWRLVRHDFSEDVVMRPAFASVLGNYGAKMIEQDRADHAGGRRLLVCILGELNLLMRDEVEERHRERPTKVIEMVTGAFDELAEHMKVESGEVLPYFESVISADVSTKLAKEYANTLLVTPDLTWMERGIGVASEQAVFGGGVREYINTTPVELKECYIRILQARQSEAGRAWFDKMTDKELEKIRIKKKPTRGNTGAEADIDGRKRESRKAKISQNALGLPVSWHHFKKGKL